MPLLVLDRRDAWVTAFHSEQNDVWELRYEGPLESCVRRIRRETFRVDGNLVQLLLHRREKAIGQWLSTFTKIPSQDFIHIPLNGRMKFKVHRFNEGSWMPARNSAYPMGFTEPFSSSSSLSSTIVASSLSDQD